MKNVKNNLLKDSPQKFRDLIKTYPYYDEKYGSLIGSAMLADKKGLWAEFGVYSGETLKILTNINLKGTVYGFDSFEGLPEDWNSDNPKGKFNTKGNPPFIPSPQMELVKGWFEDTIPKFIKDQHPLNIDFLHLDADLYSSTKCVFDNFKPYFKGKVIINFDEFFGYDGWENHEYLAFKEFVNDMGNNIKDIKILSYSNNGEGVKGYHPTAFEINFKQ